jgi:hypothetical protein
VLISDGCDVVIMKPRGAVRKEIVKIGAISLYRVCSTS